MLVARQELETDLIQGQRQPRALVAETLLLVLLQPLPVVVAEALLVGFPLDLQNVWALQVVLAAVRVFLLAVVEIQLEEQEPLVKVITAATVLPPVMVLGAEVVVPAVQAHLMLLPALEEGQARHLL